MMMIDSKIISVKILLIEWYASLSLSSVMQVFHFPIIVDDELSLQIAEICSIESVDRLVSVEIVGVS